MTKTTDSAGAPATAGEKPLLSIDSAIFKNVKVSLEARLGRTEMSVEELLALKPGSVVTLDMKMNEPVDLYLNDSPVARGEIVAVDDSFGIRILSVADIG